MREYKALRTISRILSSYKHTKPVANQRRKLKKQAHKILRRLGKKEVKDV